MSRVLIVGAGLSGLVAARQLQLARHEVLVVEKGGAIGGRIATCRIGDATFDDGAQFFTVRGREFKIEVASWELMGLAHRWFEGYLALDDEKSHDVYTRFCGTRSMVAIAKYLGRGLNIQLKAEIHSLRFTGKNWIATSGTGHEYSADKLLLTAPLPQSLALFDTSGQTLPVELRIQLESVGYVPCFSVRALLNGPSRIPPPGALYINQEPLAWIADNHQKGISMREGAVTIHSTGVFACTHFEHDRDEVGKLLLDAAHEYLGQSVRSFEVHRWRYSKVIDPLSIGAVQVPELNVCFAGDGLCDAKVEGAYRSGLEAARVLGAS